MALEIILVILGGVTAGIGVWNIVTGAYIWGILFVLGGAWALWLGTAYILQLKKAKQKKADTPEDGASEGKAEDVEAVPEQSSDMSALEEVVIEPPADVTALIVEEDAKAPSDSDEDDSKEV